MKKVEIFKRMVFESFKESPNYDIIIYGMLRARELMLKHKSFSNASAESQFDMCTTIYLIATQSGTKAICSLKIIKVKNEEKFNYALDEGYQNAKVITIDQ